jgi:hypothetical protein
MDRFPEILELPGILNLKIADPLHDIHNLARIPRVHITGHLLVELQHILSLPGRIELVQALQGVLNHVHILLQQGHQPVVPIIVVHQELAVVVVVLIGQALQIQVAQGVTPVRAVLVHHAVAQEILAIRVLAVAQAVAEAQATPIAQAVTLVGQVLPGHLDHPDQGGK